MNDDEYRRMRAAEDPEYESANGQDASEHTAPDETDEDARYDLGYPEEPQEEDAGRTMQEIADAVGYSTASAVHKRIARIAEQFEAFTNPPQTDAERP